MKKIYLIAIIFCSALSSCSLFRYSDPKLYRVWMLTDFQGYSKEYLTEKKASLDMKEKEFAKAYMGCNQISYNYYNKHKDEINFKGGLSTSMACENMDLEDKFNQIMQQITHYQVEGHRLILKTADGAAMSFVAQDWD